MNIYNLHELESRGTLRSGDRVYFSHNDIDLEYIVYSRHLYLYTNCPPYTEGENHAIFHLLDIKASFAFAEKYYGYQPHGGIWPSYHEDDFEAATRLVKALYRKWLELERIEYVPFPFMGIFSNRSDIIDLD